jgi:branched-chain amino acid transport system substrate-binding protein
MNLTRRALLGATLLSAVSVLPLGAFAADVANAVANSAAKPAAVKSMPGVVVTPAAMSASTAGPTSMAGLTDKEIVLGESAPFTGSASELGKRMNAGAVAYFDIINEQGGVNGRKITLKTLDDAYDPPKAKANTEQFVKEGVFALFGYVGTPTTVAARPVFVAAKLPLVAAFTGSAGLRAPVERYIFNVRSTYNQEVEQQIQEVTAVGGKRIAVFYQNDAYGKAGLDAALLALGKRNLKPIALATVERGSVEVSGAVRKIVDSKPDAIIMVSAYNSIAPFVKGVKALGGHPSFYNVSFVGSIALRDELAQSGPGVIITQVVPSPFVRAIPIVAEYQDAMKKKGDTNYEFTSLEGFISAKVMVEGLKRAGRDLTREGLINALETIDGEDLGGFVVSYSPTDHSGSNMVETTMIGNKGRFIQ